MSGEKTETNERNGKKNNGEEARKEKEGIRVSLKIKRRRRSMWGV